MLLNPTLKPTAACPGGGVLSAQCFEGWHSPSGHPVSFDSSKIFMQGSLCGIANDAVRAAFVEPLRPGESYKLCFQFLVPDGSSSLREDPDSTSVARALVALDMVRYYMNLSSDPHYMNAKNCSLPHPTVPDWATLKESGVGYSDTTVWMVVNPPSNNLWKSVCVTFVPERPSRYLFISMAHTGILKRPSSLYIKNLAVWEMCDG